MTRSRQRGSRATNDEKETMSVRSEVPGLIAEYIESRRQMTKSWRFLSEKKEVTRLIGARCSRATNDKNGAAQ